ncbi:MAG: hypothetical protein V1802_00560 [Candidatus Aenigmatarchaeota archaeon]
MLYDIGLYHKKSIDEALLIKNIGGRPIAHFGMPSLRDVVKFIRFYEGLLQKHCKHYVPEKIINAETDFVSHRNRCWLDLSGDTSYIRHHKEIVGSYDPDDDIELRKVLKGIEHFSYIMERESRERTVYTDEDIAEIEFGLRGKISELNFDNFMTEEEFKKCIAEAYNAIHDE